MITRDLVTTLGTQATLVGLGIGQAAFLARSLGPTGRGEFGLCLLVAGSACVLPLAGEHAMIIHTRNQRSQPSGKTVFESCFMTALKRLPVSIGIAITAALLLNAGALSFATGVSLALLSQLNTLVGFHFQGQIDFLRFNAYRVAVPALFLSIVLLAHTIIGLNSMTAVACLIGANGAIAFVQHSDSASRKQTQCVSPHFPRRAFAIADLTRWVVSQCERLLIALTLTLADLGLYSVIGVLLSLARGLGEVVGQLIFARLAQRRVATEVRLTRRTPVLALGAFLAVSSTIAFSLKFLLPDVIEAVFGAEFTPAAPAAAIAIWTALLALGLGGMDGYWKAARRPWITTSLAITCAGIGTVIYLAGTHTLIGLCSAFLASHLIAVGSTVVLLVTLDGHNSDDCRS